MRQVYLSELDEERAFAEKAARHFEQNPSHSSFGDIEQDTFFALRWGLGEDCVLVLKLSDRHEPTNYCNVIKKAGSPDFHVELRIAEFERIYAEADRLGCRLPSGDDPEGYGITPALRNQEG